MFKNLVFERLRITSPRLYHTNVKQKNFKKMGGCIPPWHGSCLPNTTCEIKYPPTLGTISARCRDCQGHRKKVKKSI